MREIKFRGKRKDNGEWVYGSLVNNFWANSKTKSPVCEIFTPALEDGDCWDDYVSDENSVVEVHTESVGQFTGLKDKYGKEIYDGDIIGRRGMKNTFVEYERCRWVLRYDEPKAEWRQDLHNQVSLHLEVIGNIYENPELLK